MGPATHSIYSKDEENPTRGNKTAGPWSSRESQDVLTLVSVQNGVTLMLERSPQIPYAPMPTVVSGEAHKNTATVSRSISQRTPITFAHRCRGGTSGRLPATTTPKTTLLKLPRPLLRGVTSEGNMSHRGNLSPPWKGQTLGGTTTLRSPTRDEESPSPPRDVQRIPIHKPRLRSSSSYLIAALEGLVSGVAFLGASTVALPIIPHEDHASPFVRAMRTGACLALSTPSLVLAGRFAFFVASLRSKTVQQPSLGFALPPGFDEHAVLDLYVMGLGAGLLGGGVPALEILGNLLGTLLIGPSMVVSTAMVFLAFVLISPALYFAFGECLKAAAPLNGLAPHTTPKKGMWVLSAMGHSAILCGSFYSPDVDRKVGFVLGFIHIVRLLRQAFAWPGGAWDEVVLSSDDWI